MISIEIGKRDLRELTKAEIGNLPGALFVGASPLLKPFMKKLEVLLPPDIKGRGDSYVLSALHSHIDEVHADGDRIMVRSRKTAVEIRREELDRLMCERYPSTDHQRLNLPGLLFLQSSPALQAASAIILRRDHHLAIPEGRRTRRYIFHMGVASMEADAGAIRICFDPDRLPRRPDGSSVLE
ncbi:MAG: hypothetical protein QUS08_10515 [Methanothrix sp.]|nr:hypothetical protein [Methanothrix sp.]